MSAADFTVTTISVPLCPNCLDDLMLLERYFWAPSIAWCSRCVLTFDVEYEDNSQRWVVRP